MDERAACRNTPPHWWDGDGDPREMPPRLKAICESCPLRPECLEWALTDKIGGFLGGMTEYQRRQLRRQRSRHACPGCGGDLVANTFETEICVSCGTSWYVGS